MRTLLPQTFEWADGRQSSGLEAHRSFEKVGGKGSTFQANSHDWNASGLDEFARSIFW